ncbi:MAG: hypothetical protein ACPF80_06570, partial [Flavobacteriaceae bacterium]
EIVVENKKAVGIRVKGTTHKADVVVSNMDVVPTYRHLMPTQKAPEKSLGQELSSSAVIFYWGVNRLFPELDLHNIFFSRIRRFIYRKRPSCRPDGLCQYHGQRRAR